MKDIDFHRQTKKITEFLKEYYPALNIRIYILNSGMMLSALWKIMKNFVATEFQQKVIFCGKNYLDVLSQEIDPINLPKEIGGGNPIPIIEYVNTWDDPAEIKRLNQKE